MVSDKIFVETIIIEGIKTVVKNPDLDGDGFVNGYESVTAKIGDPSITQIMQPTEIGDSLKELNNDNIDVSSRMSGIDMRSRLHHLEISSVLALDALVSLRVLPTRVLAFTRQKKRLAISLNGKGREDIVNIVAGKRDLEANTFTGVKDRIGNFFGQKKE